MVDGDQRLSRARVPGIGGDTQVSDGHGLVLCDPAAVQIQLAEHVVGLHIPRGREDFQRRHRSGRTILGERVACSFARLAYGLRVGIRLLRLGGGRFGCGLRGHGSGRRRGSRERWGIHKLHAAGAGAGDGGNLFLAQRLIRRGGGGGGRNGSHRHAGRFGLGCSNLFTRALLNRILQGRWLCNPGGFGSRHALGRDGGRILPFGSKLGRRGWRHTAGSRHPSGRLRTALNHGRATDLSS